MTTNDIENRICQSLMWLGFEDVEIGKKFSADKFTKNEAQVLEKEITYGSKDNLVPKALAGNLIKFMEMLLNYHKQLEEKKAQLQKENKEND